MSPNETSPAHTPTPWRVGPSQCDGVYGGEEHWAILGPDTSGVIADVEHGLSQQARANAEFIVQACNAHEDMRQASQKIYDALRQASQALYDAMQYYLDVSDDELIEQGYVRLVEAMNAIEAAWNKADGTAPDKTALQNWAACPTCLTPTAQEASHDSLEFENGRVVREVTCCKCGAEWHEWYRPDNRVVTMNGVLPKDHGQA